MVNQFYMLEEAKWLFKLHFCADTKVGVPIVYL